MSVIYYISRHKFIPSSIQEYLDLETIQIRTVKKSPLPTLSSKTKQTKCCSMFIRRKIYCCFTCPNFSCIAITIGLGLGLKKLGNSGNSDSLDYYYNITTLCISTKLRQSF